MTMLPVPQRTRVESSGPKDAKIVLIGEAPARDEVIRGEPFVGRAGEMLTSLLHAAGITRSECYITNLFKMQGRVVGGKANNISHWWTAKSGFSDAGKNYIAELAEELSDVNANVIVTLGAPAMCALTGLSGKSQPIPATITARRGYITTATEKFNYRKVIPTLHPAMLLYGGTQIEKYFIAHDLRKAKAQSEWPEIKPVPYELVYDYDNDLDVIYTHLMQIDINARTNDVPISVDIEVSNYEVSAISFTNATEKISISIPLDDRWDIHEEHFIWTTIAEILEDESTKKTFQNGIFDMFFLYQNMGIVTQGYVYDTMIAHSIMYPDFPKSLQFLASVYTNSPFWKDMTKFKQIKMES